MNITIKKLSSNIVLDFIKEFSNLEDLGFLTFKFNVEQRKALTIKMINKTFNNIKKALSDERYQGYFTGFAQYGKKMQIRGYIKDPSGQVITNYNKIVGYGTHNKAQYNSLLYLLLEARKKGINKIVIYSNSKLVVNQVNQIWKTKTNSLKLLLEDIYSLLPDIEDCLIKLTKRKI